LNIYEEKDFIYTLGVCSKTCAKARLGECFCDMDVRLDENLNVFGFWELENLYRISLWSYKKRILLEFKGAK
jgi:hypothetical protein